MKHLEKLREVLCEELDKFGKSGDISVNSLEKIHKLSDTIKNLDKIMILAAEKEGGYSEAGDWMGEGRMYGTSYARGRYGNVKRDSMGRYSSDMDDDYSERRMGRGYSRDEAADRLMSKIGEMMENASPKEREVLKECMKALERT